MGSDNIGGLAARRKRNVLIVLVATLVLAVAAAVVLVVVLRPWKSLVALRHGGLTIAAPPTLPEQLPLQLAPIAVSAPSPNPQLLAATLGPLAANRALGAFSGSVSDAATGVVLWSSQPDRPMLPASTTKVLTAAAAIAELPLDHRVATTVSRGAAANELVLVGGGDPTLTAQPTGRPNYYAGAAHLDDLVEQIRRSGVLNGNQVDTLLVDVSAYSGPTLAPGWLTADIAGGSFAPIEPVMIDGGRLRPMQDYSPRSATPALDAGRMLAQRLGLNPTKVRIGTAQPGAASVATVQSAPLRDRLRQVVTLSDDVLAEAVGREIAVKMGSPASFSGAAAAVTSALQRTGFDLTGVTLNDTSGLSEGNLIPARVLDGVLSAAAGNSKPKLRPMLDDLPVAGATGTLSDRYSTSNRSAAGWLRAKTGTLDRASTLAGYVVDGSNRVLTFALMSNNSPPDISRPALDAIASALRSCGCR